MQAENTPQVEELEAGLRKSDPNFKPRGQSYVLGLAGKGSGISVSQKCYEMLQPVLDEMGKRRGRTVKLGIYARREAKTRTARVVANLQQGAGRLRAWADARARVAARDGYSGVPLKGSAFYRAVMAEMEGTGAPRVRRSPPSPRRRAAAARSRSASRSPPPQRRRYATRAAARAGLDQIGLGNPLA